MKTKTIELVEDKATQFLHRRGDYSFSKTEHNEGAADQLYMSFRRRAEEYCFAEPENPESFGIDNQSTLNASLCLNLARELAAQGHLRRARRYIHEVIEDLIAHRNYATCDAILISADPTTDPIGLLISLLTATKVVKKHLTFREKFFASVESAVADRRAEEPGLLDGLD